MGAISENKPASISRADQANNFFTAIGRGISRWSRMEERLVRIAATLLRTSEAKAGLVMYSIISFHVWLQLIDELFVLDGTYPRSLKRWRNIAQSLKAENDIRARLAHQSLSQDKEKIGNGPEIYLRPTKLDLRAKSMKAKPLTNAAIDEFSRRVAVTHVNLILLLRQMKKRKSLR